MSTREEKILELGELLDEMCGIQLGYEMATDRIAKQLDKDMAICRAKIIALVIGD